MKSVQKLVILLISTLLMSFSFISNKSISYALENTNATDLGKGSSYYLIHYDGEEQMVSINEEITLVLKGWADETQSSINTTISHSTNQPINTVLLVSEGLGNLYLTNDESIFYRVIVSDSFSAEKVTPLVLNDEWNVVEKNDNGTSIEERTTADEYGTFIRNHELVYVVSEDNNQKREITEEEYYSLNPVIETSPENKTQDAAVEDPSLIDQSLVSAKTTTKQTVLNNTAAANPTVVYSTHVQSYGWLDTVSNGKMSGTSGEAKRLEAIKISLKNAPFPGEITYKTHVQTYGWLNNVSNGAISGTSGEAKRLEAIQIKLTGEMEKNYDIYYRVHSQTYGWLDWAKNGQSAGTQGLSKRLEAIQIVLVGKGGAAPGATNKPLVMDPSVSYSTHVQGLGWLPPVSDGKLSGTSGQSRRLEAIKISLKNKPYAGGITYKTHVQRYGWLNNVSNGALSGTSGEGKRLEAIQINLTGEMAQRYDVYYRVHAQTYGWLDWAKNGQSAGTEALSKRLEAIEVVLVEKGGTAPGSTNKPYVKPSVITTYNNYNLTLNNAINLQMQASPLPQTDKYRNTPAYVSRQYLQMFDGGSITGSSVNLRTSPVLSIDSNIATNVKSGTAFLVLDDNVTGDTFSGSTRWYKIQYDGKELYVHNSLASINSRVGKVTADILYIRADKNNTSHIYGSAGKGSLLTVLVEDNTSGWYTVSIGDWRNATSSDVKGFLDPTKYIGDEKYRLQFMNLSKPSDVSVEILNQYLTGKGILANQGQAFIDAGKKYGINEVYLMAHTLLETGNGSSTLAKGVVYKDRTVYNMYGVGAYDSCPLDCGAKTAYENGWFTPYAAIVGGAAFISNKYLGGNNPYKIVQNTIYEMRWNPELMSTKLVAGNQYASDIGWAYKQVNTMYEVYKIQPYTIYLEIPKYK